MKAAHKDYRLELRVRNANILNAMDAKGIKTVADLARKAHSDQGDVGRLVNLLDSPFRKDGCLRPVTIRVCEALGCIPSDLFCDAQRDALTTNRAEMDISAEQAFALSHSQGRIKHDDGLTESLDRALKTLTSREERIVRQRIGWYGDPKTLREIAELNGVSVERVRQVEQKAYRKLRHPDNSTTLRAFA